MHELQDQTVGNFAAAPLPALIAYKWGGGGGLAQDGGCVHGLILGKRLILSLFDPLCKIKSSSQNAVSPKGVGWGGGVKYEDFPWRGARGCACVLGPFACQVGDLPVTYGSFPTWHSFNWRLTQRDLLHVKRRSHVHDWVPSFFHLGGTSSSISSCKTGLADSTEQVNSHSICSEGGKEREEEEEEEEGR